MDCVNSKIPATVNVGSCEGRSTPLTGYSTY
jgi:hypothetical protein